jgi:argininosuccinate lyase
MATKAAWGGRFQEPTDAHAARFLESVSFDLRLADEDIAGSLAHAEMLRSIGVLTHMNVESTLTAREGDVGARIHTGRSRNDQVATDMRLWARDACTRVGRALDRLTLTRSARRRFVSPMFRLHLLC